MSTAMVTTDPAALADELRPALTALTLLLRREAQHAALSPSQATVLASIDREGPRRIGDVSAALHVSQPSATVLVKRLERDGLVRRTTDPQDSRAVLVTLTDRGRDVLAEAAAARSALLASRLAGLTPEQRAAISSAVPALLRLATEAPSTPTGETPA